MALREDPAAVFAHLILGRPLVVLDAETTGLDPQADRIVELAVLRVGPGGSRDALTLRFDPGVPIPPAATAVHGITDEDVAGAPRFAELAADLLAFLGGCDLAGFGLKRFDLPLLCAEFRRAGLSLPLAGRAVLDVLEIYHARHPRTLAAAVRRYCGREHAGAHGAGADVVATAEVLDSMLGHYGDLPRWPAELHRHLRPDAVDVAGNFRLVDGEVRFAFGRHRGRPLGAVAEAAPDYLRWMLKAGFLDDAKGLVRDALAASQNARCGRGGPAGRAGRPCAPGRARGERPPRKPQAGRGVAVAIPDFRCAEGEP
jgi:DNA polymerase-3 subunit epsilon